MSTFEAEMENHVRDMYEGVNREEMTEAQRKTFRSEKLSTNPNVLFRIYKKGHLHILQFSSIHYDEWVLCLKSYQINFQHLITLNVFSLCGPSSKLQRFCDEYNENLEMIV